MSKDSDLCDRIDELRDRLARLMAGLPEESEKKK